MCHLPLISLPFFPSPIRQSCFSHFSFKTSRLPTPGIPHTSPFPTDPTRWSLSSSSQSCSVSVTVRWNFLPATTLPCRTSFVPDRPTTSASSQPLFPHLAHALAPHLKEDQASQRGMSVVSRHVPPQAQKTQPSGRVYQWVSQ